MEVSTSLNIYKNFTKSYEEAVKRASDCGFSCFDFNPSDYKDGDNFYTADNWRENIVNIRRYAESLGVKFMQAHAFCFNDMPDDMEYQMRKSIEAAALAGVPWTVMHPWVTHKTSKDEILKENIRLFEPYIEYAKELGIGIAIENMPKRMYWFGEEVKSEAFSTADELIEIIDLLNEFREEMDMSYLFISHDLGVVQSFCDRAIVMHNGKAVEEGAVDDIINNPQAQYTKDLVDSVL